MDFTANLRTDTGSLVLDGDMENSSTEDPFNIIQFSADRTVSAATSMELTVTPPSSHPPVTHPLLHTNLCCPLVSLHHNCSFSLASLTFALDLIDQSCFCSPIGELQDYHTVNSALHLVLPLYIPPLICLICR